MTMAFLNRTKKQDLISLADELGENPSPNLKIIELRDLILKSTSYEEDFVKGILETIVSTREEEAQEREQIRHFELKKLRIEAGRSFESTSSIPEEGSSHRNKRELTALMPKFDPKEGDILLYLSLFERQAKRAHVDVRDWVACLLTLLPSEIVQLIAQESEESFEDYEHIKDMLLRRFKLNPKEFRKKFVQHHRDPNKSWRTFVFELSKYFQGWIEGLEIKEFDTLKNLMITDQVKRRVPLEIREHFLDEWGKIVSPSQFAQKLDEYESAGKLQKIKDQKRANQWSVQPQAHPNGSMHSCNDLAAQ